jgi:radical SAM protein with 4Fe4S-binding SPASM domain
MGFGYVYEITSQCNQACVFCYNVWLDNDANATQDADKDKVTRILDNALAHTEAEWLTFAGGEPLLSPNLPHAIAYARDNFPHIKLGVASNGQLATKNILEELTAAGIMGVEIPLHTHDKDAFQAITGGGSSTKAREAIAHAAACGLYVTVPMTLTAQTSNDIDETIELAILLGAHRVALNRFIPTGRGKVKLCQNSITDEQLKRLLRIANECAERLDFKVSVTIPVEPCLIPHSEYPMLEFAPCVCGKDKWTIGPDGTLRTCEQNNESLGSLLTTDAHHLMNQQYIQDFHQNTRFPHCHKCTDLPACGGGCRFALRDA